MLVSVSPNKDNIKYIVAGHVKHLGLLPISFINVTQMLDVPSFFVGSWMIAVSYTDTLDKS